MKLETVLCAAVLAAAGCGGDDGNDEAERPGAASATATAVATRGASSMPAAEWATQVEEICDQNANKAEAEGVLIAQQVQEQGGSQEEAVARVLERGAELTEPLLDQIAAMPRPVGKEQQAKEFDQRMRALLPVMRDMADTVRESSSQADLERVTKKLLKDVLPVRALARDLNIHACLPNNARP